ncbi:S8 family serine peptidase, partial [Methanolobus psychrotolerans]|uniref:S8 family serine peptidase n=1 Tax=Methanolobus psychrotolerans TaxID=1874706 RepID=UPI0013ED407D
MVGKTVLFLSIIVILLSPLASSASGENTIFLRSGNINTDLLSEINGSEYSDIKTSSISELEDDSAYGYYIVQFEGPIREEWKSEVQNTGAEFFDYVPDNAFVLRMNVNERDLVESLEFVHWTGEYLPEYKYTSEVVNLVDTSIQSGSGEVIDLLIFLFDPDESPEVVARIVYLEGLILENSGNHLRIQIPSYNVENLASINGISWIEPYAELSISNDVAAGLINIRSVHNTLSLKGNGQIVAVCDTGLDTGINDNSMHADIRGRILSIADFSVDGAADISGHGTHVVGSLLGNGAMSDGQYTGMAPQASLVFQAVETDSGALNIPTDLNKIFLPAYNAGARIHSNSWGSENNGRYDGYSYYVDQFSWNHPDMLIIVSAGNDGEDVDIDGVIDPDSLNTPATAKNCIAVGASESERGDTFSSGSYSTWGTRWASLFPTNPIYSDYMADDSEGIAAFSSRGPTDDGRIKPDIVAPGTFIISTKSSQASWYDWGALSENPNYAYMGGTSMSAPIVAGAAALVREYYMEIEGLENPSAALIKATLLNGAYNMTPGQYEESAAQEISGRPDYSQGWGRLDVENSILVPYPEVIAYFDGISLSTSQSWNHTYDYVKGNEPLRATLAWTDYPGAVFSSKNLINDLDMTISTPSGSYYGNNAPDRTNNVEGIELENIVEGNQIITIIGHNVIHGPQPFALVLSFTCNNNEFPSPGSYVSNSSTPVSTDLVHPVGVNPTSIQMMINDIPVSFSTVPISGGYSISYNTPTPYPAGEYNVSVTALTDTGQQFSYNWKFTVTSSSSKLITGFSFEELAVTGEINEAARTISITVPYGTDVKSLTPTIVHTGASITPGSGVAQDFTNPVTYTVAAEDETTRSYAVTVTSLLNPAKSITSFSFTDPTVAGVINEAARTISITVPYGTDVTGLTPTIVHTGASITPGSGVAQDFTNPVTYTVTAEDETTRSYAVTVTSLLNPAKSITGFSFTDPAVAGVINEAARTISITVPYGTDVTGLTPTIVHTGASITPGNGIAQDFTNPVTYTVTAEDGTTRSYT